MGDLATQPDLHGSNSPYILRDVIATNWNPLPSIDKLQYFDDDKRDAHGQNLLHHLCEKGEKQALQYLVKRPKLLRLDINGQDKNGWTPLITAAFFGHVSICAFLLKNRADPHILTNTRSSVLHYLVTLDQDIYTVGKTGILYRKFLLSLLKNHSLNVNATNLSGETALHKALLHRNFNIAKTLLAQGSDPYLQNSASQDCFFFAYRYKAPADLINIMKTGEPSLSQDYDSLKWENPRQLVEGLPLEVLLSIIKKLENIRDVVALLSTCKFLRELGQCELVWEETAKHFFPLFTDQKLPTDDWKSLCIARSMHRTSFQRLQLSKGISRIPTKPIYPSPTSSTHNDFVLKISMIGDFGVGKSSLLRRFLDDQQLSTSPNTTTTTTTTNFNQLPEMRQTTLNVKGWKIQLQLWDVFESDRYNSHRATLAYRHISGAIVVFDRTDPSSFKNAGLWLQEIHRYASVGVNVIIAGNKSDVEDSSVISEEVLAQFGEAMHWKYVHAGGELGSVDTLPTSAVSGEGVDRLFGLLVERILERCLPNRLRELHPTPLMTTSTITTSLSSSANGAAYHHTGLRYPSSPGNIHNNVGGSPSALSYLCRSSSSVSSAGNGSSYNNSKNHSNNTPRSRNLKTLSNPFALRKR